MLRRILEMTGAILWTYLTLWAAIWKMAKVLNFMFYEFHLNFSKRGQNSFMGWGPLNFLNFRKKLSKKGPGVGQGGITGKTRLRSTGEETGKRHWRESHLCRNSQERPSWWQIMKDPQHLEKTVVICTQGKLRILQVLSNCSQIQQLKYQHFH